MVKMEFETLTQWINQIAEPLKRLKRAMQGLPIEDDVFSGLLNVKDVRERARLSQAQIYANGYRRLVSKYGGREFKIMKDVAVMKDVYSICKDGEQRKEAILMQKAKTEVSVVPSGPQVLGLPEVQTKPKEEKKGWFRGKKE